MTKIIQFEVQTLNLIFPGKNFSKIENVRKKHRKCFSSDTMMGQTLVLAFKDPKVRICVDNHNHSQLRLPSSLPWSVSYLAKGSWTPDGIL